MKPNSTTPPSDNTYYQYSTSNYNTPAYFSRQTYPIEQPTSTLIDQAFSLKRGPAARERLASSDLAIHQEKDILVTGPISKVDIPPIDTNISSGQHLALDKPKNPLPQNLTVEEIENYVDNGCEVPLEGKKIRFLKARSGERNSVRYTADTGILTGRSDYSIMGLEFQQGVLDPNFSTRNMDDMYSMSKRELAKPAYYNRPARNSISYSSHQHEERKQHSGMSPNSREKIMELVRGNQAKDSFIPAQKPKADYTYADSGEKAFSPIENNSLPRHHENNKVEPKEIETYWPKENYEEKRFESVQSQSIVEEVSEDTDSDMFDSYYDELGPNNVNSSSNRAHALNVVPQKTLLETINNPAKPVSDSISGNQETSIGEKKDKAIQGPSQKSSMQLHKYEEELERLLREKSKDQARTNNNREIAFEEGPVKEAESEKKENSTILEVSGDFSLNESLWESSLNNSDYLSQVRRRHKSGLRYTEIWTSWVPNPDRKNPSIQDSGSKPLLKFSKAPLISYCFEKYENS